MKLKLKKKLIFLFLPDAVTANWDLAAPFCPGAHKQVTWPEEGVNNHVPPLIHTNLPVTSFHLTELCFCGTVWN